MCGLPPAIVSANWRDRQNWPFRGLEYRRHPLPLDHRFSPLLGQNLAPKQRFRHRLPRHLPASPLSVGPFMVELFAFPFCRGIPEPGSRSGSAVTSLKAPHAGTRCTNPPLLAGPSPVGGFAASCEGYAPTSAHDILDHTSRGLSASPPFPEQRYRIERRDYSERRSWDTKPEPVRITPTEPPSSTDKPVSRHPALLAQHLMVGYAIPLARLVAEFAGCAARSEGRNGTFAPLTTAEHSPALKRIPEPAALSTLTPYFSEREQDMESHASR